MKAINTVNSSTKNVDNQIDLFSSISKNKSKFNL